VTATIERGLRREATRPSRSASRASFFSAKRDRSVSGSGFLMAPSLEKGEIGRRHPAPATLHNFTRRRNGLNPTYRSLLRKEHSFGPTAMGAFRIHFRG